MFVFLLLLSDVLLLFSTALFLEFSSDFFDSSCAILACSSFLALKLSNSFSFLQPRVYKTHSEYLSIKEKYDNLQKEYDSLNEKISNDTNSLNSKKEDLTKSNEDLQNKLNSLNKEIQSLN